MAQEYGSRQMGKTFEKSNLFFNLSGNKNQRTISCQSLKKQQMLIQKKFTTLQRNFCQEHQKETSFTQVWRKSCQVPLTKLSKLPKLEN
jgi:hypothetical protein